MAEHGRTGRKRLDPGERRAQLLDGAMQLFAEKHYSTVTMRDIAGACGVNVALIYHYFDSKEALLKCAVRNAMAELMNGYGAAARGDGDPLADLEDYVDVLVRVAPLMVRMTKLMSDYATSEMREPALDAEIAAFYAEERRILAAALARGVARGRFRPLDPERIARQISLMFDGIFFAAPTRADDRVVADLGELRVLIGEMTRP